MRHCFAVESTASFSNTYGLIGVLRFRSSELVLTLRALHSIVCIADRQGKWWPWRSSTTIPTQAESTEEKIVRWSPGNALTTFQIIASILQEISSFSISTYTCSPSWNIHIFAPLFVWKHPWGRHWLKSHWVVIKKWAPQATETVKRELPKHRPF